MLLINFTGNAELHKVFLYSFIIVCDVTKTSEIDDLLDICNIVDVFQELMLDLFAVLRGHRSRVANAVLIIFES